MLTVLMYHHINGDKYSNNLDVFEKHLQYLIDRYIFVVPTDTIESGKKYICLTFDDAYYDFYHYVFPLLKKYNIKAMLAVPTGLINKQTIASTEERLALGHEEIYKNKNYQKFGTFCTWDELREMHESGLVIMASHSHRHKDLSLDDIDLIEEIVHSKKVLEEKLSITIKSFILPFGRYNYHSMELLKKHYKYIFKVGQGKNRNFSGINGLIYRIDADNTNDIKTLFTFKRRMQYFMKSFLKGIYDGIQKR